MSSHSLVDRAALKARLRTLVEELAGGLLERHQVVRLALLAALAGEHTLLIGPPGTAKSETARRLHRAFREARYFQRLLTRFSVPEEIFGPLSLSALDEDRYERRTEGFLPTASIAFIDEVFQANSAILNALLTLLNEREFDNGNRRLTTPLLSVVAASHAVPQDEVLQAFHDRFLLRLAVEPVSAEAFPALLALGETQAPQPEPALLIGPEELALWQRAAEQVLLPPGVVELLTGLRAELLGRNIAVSDRRWRKTVKLLRVSAWTDGRDQVSPWDLWLLQFCLCAEPAQGATVREWLMQHLGTDRVMNPARFTRVVEQWETTLREEREARDLDYDREGRLALGSPGTEQAPFFRPRRYSGPHLEARVSQVESLREELERYMDLLRAHIADTAVTLAAHLWVSPTLAPEACAVLEQTLARVRSLHERVVGLREGFAALPRQPDPPDPPDPQGTAA